VSKATHFMTRNVGIRDDVTVSDVSVAQSNSIMKTTNQSLLNQRVMNFQQFVVDTK